MVENDPDWSTSWTLNQLAERFVRSDTPKALRFAEPAAARARALRGPERVEALATIGPVLIRLNRVDAGRRIIDEAAEAAAQLGTKDRAAFQRALAAGALAPYDLKRAMALIEPLDAHSQQRLRAITLIAQSIAVTDTAQAVALAGTLGRPYFFEEEAKTEIAYKIGADRPDEAVKIIESMKRDLSTQSRAEAFGWLAVALAPRDRVRAFGLIDRALDLTIDDRESSRRAAASGAGMASAARIASCARRIGYPDMQSVIMRVIAARPGDENGNRPVMMQAVAVATVPLALIDPGTARTVLEQLEARSGFDPASLWNVREPWLTAWALIDLKKAEAIFDAELAAMAGGKDADARLMGFFNVVQLLAAPPGRREAALHRGAYAGHWRPSPAF